MKARYSPALQANAVFMLAVVGSMACVAGLAPSQALADAKIYSGAECVTFDADEVFAPQPIYLYGTALNRNINTVVFECPIVWDRIDDAEVQSAKLRALDRNGAEDISCSIWSMRRQSNGWFGNKVNRTTSGSSSDDQELSFTKLTHRGQDAQLLFRCSVPGNFVYDASGIVSYRVDE